jgi:hypothetical protein
LDCKGVQSVYYTNEHGFYYASNIPAGEYIVAVVNMNTTYKKTVAVSTDETREINFEVSGVIEIIPIEVNGGVTEKPLLNVFDPDAIVLDRKDVKETLALNIHDIAGTQPGIVEVNGEDYVRGARAGSLVYYIDNCKTMGDPEIPLCGLDTYRVYTGFIPPKYGDTVGGVIVMETRNYFKEH